MQCNVLSDTGDEEYSIRKKLNIVEHVNDHL